jgi:SAM-dependent methyltransferase
MRVRSAKGWARIGQMAHYQDRQNNEMHRLARVYDSTPVAVLGLPEPARRKCRSEPLAPIDRPIPEADRRRRHQLLKQRTYTSPHLIVSQLGSVESYRHDELSKLRQRAWIVNVDHRATILRRPLRPARLARALLRPARLRAKRAEPQDLDSDAHESCRGDDGRGSVDGRGVFAMSLLPDYAQQAETYDQTRSASGPILAALQAAIAGAPGNRLADIGGGTGNYALALEQEGWQPVVIDRSPEMLALAAQKGLATIAAAAEQLPVANESFDAAILVSMLHHVADPGAALSEARRILQPGGRLAVMVYTREDIHDLWFLDYFPSTRAWMQTSHLPVADLLAMLPGGQRREIVLDDLKDASLAALAAYPEKVLEQRWRAQTSYFERLQRDHPAELDAGLQQLASDVAAGCATRRPGRASILAWTRGPEQ